MKITSTTDASSSQIELKAIRDLRMHVLSSRLDIKDTINRKCVYLLNKLYNNRHRQHCVQTSHESWTEWNFYNLKHPTFGNNNLCLGMSFPIFAQCLSGHCLHEFYSKFFKCDCHLCKHCGYPCSHILKITAG